MDNVRQENLKVVRLTSEGRKGRVCFVDTARGIDVKWLKQQQSHTKP